MVDNPTNRSVSGRKPGTFPPGKSGNPSGRPKDVGPIKELAKQHAPAAIAALVGALRDDNGRTRVAAAEALLDRGFGRPSQHIELDAGDELVKRMNEAAKKLQGDAG
jgi:hypothetical protein